MPCNSNDNMKVTRYLGQITSYSCNGIVKVLCDLKFCLI